MEAVEPDPNENHWVWDVAREMGSEAFAALWLRYKHHMSISEIAHVMKKSKIMVRVLLHRSRIHLAKQIANHPEVAEESHWLRGQTVFIERAK